MIKPFYLVEEKLAEAEFFLEKLINANNSELIYYFNAFVAAARNTTFVLQYVMAEVPYFKSWWKHDLDKSDPIAQYFNSKRVTITHCSGDPGIRAIGFYNNENGERIGVRLFFPKIPPQTDSFDIKKQDIITNSKKYLVWVKDIIEKTKEKYKNQIYQQGILDKEFIDKTHLSIEQIEEILGFPKGFTNFCSNDEERLLYLRATIYYE